MQGVLVARDGLSFQVIGPRSLFPKKRQEVDVPVDGSMLDFISLGFVVAEQLDRAPHKVINEMYT